MDKNKLIMLIGLPASGKSNIANEFKQQGYIVHSSDDIRKELTGFAENQDKNIEVFNILHNRIFEDLRKGKDVVYDATNIALKNRVKFLRKFNEPVNKDLDVYKIAYVVYTPYLICCENNKNRERVVPQEVLSKMYQSFEFPYLSEGFDEIKIHWYDENAPHIKEWYNEDTLKQFVHFIDKLDHKNPYHTLTIGEHCYATLETMMELISTKYMDILESREINLLTIAANEHDWGKMFCSEYNLEKGYFTYYRHEKVGAYDSLAWNKYVLKDENLTDKDILDIAYLISNHMNLYNAKTEKSINKLRAKIGVRNYLLLTILHEADMLSK